MRLPKIILLAALVLVAGVALFFFIRFLLTPPAEIVISREGKDTADLSANREVVCIGVVSRFSPPMIYQGYQPVMDYLSAHTDYRFELRLYGSYRETVEKLVSGEISAAFIGSQIYIETRDEYPILPILRPRNPEGRPYHRAVIIARSAQPDFSCASLRGARVAVPSDESFAATWFERIYLPSCRLGITDFREFNHFNYHHSVVFQILRGNCEYGVVKDRVAFEYRQKGIQIVASSPRVPSSPLVVLRGCDQRLIDQIVAALSTALEQDSSGPQDMPEWDIEFIHGFEQTEPRDYDELAQLFKDTGAR